MAGILLTRRSTRFGLDQHRETFMLRATLNCSIFVRNCTVVDGTLQLARLAFAQTAGFTKPGQASRGGVIAPGI